MLFDMSLNFFYLLCSTGSSTKTPEDKMQETRKLPTNLGVRVYPPRTKRLGKKLSMIHQGNDDTSFINENNHTKTSTPCEIDLPTYELQSNTTQTLGQKYIGLSMSSFNKKSELYNVCEYQEKPSNALSCDDEYSKRMTVSRDTRISLQNLQPVLHRDELQGAVDSKCGPTRVTNAFQSIRRLEDKGISHGESHINRNVTCMKDKVGNNGRKKSSNIKKLNRPQHQIVKFLEDYTEFGGDLKDIFNGKGKHCPTVLESTVDGSIVKGARRYVV